MLKKRGQSYDPFMVIGGLLIVGAATFFLYATFLVPYGYMLSLDKFWQKIFAVGFFVLCATIWILHSDTITLTTIFNTVSRGSYGMEEAPKTETIKPTLEELRTQIDDCITKNNKERAEELMVEVESNYNSTTEEDKKRCKKLYLKIKNNVSRYLSPVNMANLSPETKKKIEQLEKLFKDGLFTEEELEEKKNMLLQKK